PALRMRPDRRAAALRLNPKRPIAIAYFRPSKSDRISVSLGAERFENREKTNALNRIGATENRRVPGRAALCEAVGRAARRRFGRGPAVSACTVVTTAPGSTATAPHRSRWKLGVR